MVAADQPKAVDVAREIRSRSGRCFEIPMAMKFGRITKAS